MKHNHKGLALCSRCHLVWSSEGTPLGPGKDTHGTLGPGKRRGRGWPTPMPQGRSTVSMTHAPDRTKHKSVRQTFCQPWRFFFSMSLPSPPTAHGSQCIRLLWHDNRVLGTRQESFFVMEGQVCVTICSPSSPSRRPLPQGAALALVPQSGCGRSRTFPPLRCVSRECLPLGYPTAWFICAQRDTELVGARPVSAKGVNGMDAITFFVTT